MRQVPVNSEVRLKDKVALVTGGSSGIGKAICTAFANEGARVGVVASSDIKKAQAVVDDIAAKGGVATAITADVCRVDQLKMAVQTIVSEYGGLDILVNSAGVHYLTPMGATQPADIDRMIDINLRGTLQAINAAVPALEARGGGKIISLSSNLGFMGLASQATYCATKAAIVNMTKALARELGPKGINVNAIAPGLTATPMNEEMRASPDFMAHVRAITPGRLHSMPEDISGLAAFLASDDGRAMHGATVIMDEGSSTGI